MIGFSKRLGYSGAEIVNLWLLVTLRPREWRAGLAAGENIRARRRPRQGMELQRRRG